MQISYKIDLEPASFIAGDYQEFQYDITDAESGNAVDISSAKEMKVALYPYGDNETPVLVVVGEQISGAPSSFIARFDSDLTKNLNSGLYIQQPIIIDNSGRFFRPGQGTVNIYPRAHEENALTIQ